MSNMCVWPDGMFCMSEDIDEYSWKSDDYEVLSFEEAYERPELRAELEEYGYAPDD